MKVGMRSGYLHVAVVGVLSHRTYHKAISSMLEGVTAGRHTLERIRASPLEYALHSDVRS